MEKIIDYLEQKCKVACDEKCNKAFGITTRTSFQLSEDNDDYYWLPDKKMGEAPVDPGTMEGDDRKPVNKQDIPNKWCIRQCERSSMSKPEQSDLPLKLKDFSKKIYNQPWKHPKAKIEVFKY